MFPGLKAIPAFNGAGSSGSGGGGSLTLSFLNYASSTDSRAVQIPANAQPGDFAILFDVAAETSSVPSVVPSGWSSVVSTPLAGATNYRMAVSRRILSAAGGGSVIGMDTARMIKLLMVFRPSTSIVDTVASAWNSELTSGNPVSQSVTVSGIQTPLIVFAAAACSGTAPAFSTETPAMTILTRSGPIPALKGLRIGYTIYNTSPSNQSIDVDDAGDFNALQSGYLRFT